MARIPADELSEIYEVVDRRLAKAVKGRRLSDTEIEDLTAVGLLEATRAWERWAFDSGVPLAGYLAEPVYWAIRHEVDRIMDRKRRAAALDVERFAEEAGEEYAEADPRLARIDALASQHRAVAIFIALEYGDEKPKAVAARYPGRAGRPMAYVDLWREHAAGQAIVAADPVLRALWSASWTPGELSQWEAMLIDSPPALPAKEAHHLAALPKPHTPASVGEAVHEVVSLVGAWAAAVAIVRAVRVAMVARAAARWGPARAAPPAPS